MASLNPRKLELLSPAANLETAVQAILHGADAVYIGPPTHGARRAAANSLDDIRRLVEFAHPFRAKVYATVNTLVYEKELRGVEQMIRDLYLCGVDALIVQDMGILRLDIPPIALHASTQCDTRTPEKARFLQEAGFSQIVLARELSFSEIRAICESVSVPVECFVHGALCVSYSGKCFASQACFGRSANRGECAQVCRLPFTLRDATGKVISSGRHLLSLRDLNTLDILPRLVEAGASSFKIEGRLKETSYVKNVTAAYRRELDRIIEGSDGLYVRSSFGKSTVSFAPDPEKSFNRGFIHYFTEERQPKDITSPLTPKSMGERITDVNALNNGDGISWFDAKGEYQGVTVNGVANGKIIGARPFRIPARAEIHRTFNREWQKKLSKPTASRKIGVEISIDYTGLSATDERGMSVRIPLEIELQRARTPQRPEDVLGKLGNTIYRLDGFTNRLTENTFIPASGLSSLKRRLISCLDSAALSTYPLELRRAENRDFPYPLKEVDSHENVANRLAEKFYEEHGAEVTGYAIETQKKPVKEGEVLMTTRHCILRENGWCKKEGRFRFREPLTLTSGNNTFTLRFDCPRCEMQLLQR